MSRDEETNSVLILIGRRVRILRKSKGWTQEALAENACINDKEVSHIEQGKRNITINTLVKIAVALEVDFGSIMFDPKEADQ